MFIFFITLLFVRFSTEARTEPGGPQEQPPDLLEQPSTDYATARYRDVYGAVCGPNGVDHGVL